MASNRYVVPNKGGGWEVVKEGHRRGTTRTRTKTEAIAEARKIVRGEGGGEIRIMNRDGKMTDSDTVVRASRRSKK
jgi:hypothetical protein